MGHLPLIFARGPGAGARNSIGFMLITGMVIGTAFTLFVVSSIYVLVAEARVSSVSTTPRDGLCKLPVAQASATANL